MAHQTNNTSYLLKLLFLICLGIFYLVGVSQNIEDITITITFESDTASYNTYIAPLKYNKRFALSMQVDAGNSSIIDYGFPVFEGGTIDGTTYTGLRYSDGCGNSHSFKMSSAIYMFSGDDITGMDIHNDPSSPIITWEELNILYNHNWGIANKGINGNNSLTTGFVDYSIARNTSYCRRKMQNVSPGKTITNMFVNPGGVEGWSQPAFDLGSICAFNSVSTFPLGLSGGNVNETGVIWNSDRYDLYRIKAESVNIVDLADTMSVRSIDSVNYWSPIYTMSIVDDYGFANFVSDFNIIADTYGVNGTDEILMTSNEEIMDYLLLRDAVSVSENILGNQVTLSFGGSFPDYLLYYDLSLVINSDVTITDISVNGTDDFSISEIGLLNGLVNFSWDGKVIPTNEELAVSYTNLATSSKTNFDALIAMDYISTLNYGEFKFGLVEDLCSNVPGAPYDNGFCESGYPNSVLITGDSIITKGYSGELIATEMLDSYLWNTGEVTRSIIIDPTVDSKFWVTSLTKYGNTVSDTIVVFVVDSYITNNSPLEVKHLIGEPDSLWVELVDGVTPMWSTGSSNNYIIVDPDETTFYTLYVILVNDTVQELEYEVIVGNFLEFTYDTVCQGQTTILTNTSIINDTISKILWDLNGDTQFDDAEGEVVTYIFGTSGEHLVGMRIYFKNDPMDVIYNPVPVGGLPNVDFDFENNCYGSTTLFYDKSTVSIGIIDSWFWRFGDGKTDSFQNTSNYYALPDSYDATLIAWTSIGCKDSIQKLVEIIESPSIVLKAPNDSIIGNSDTVYFTKNQTTTLTVSNFASYDSVIWFDGDNTESVTIAEEGSFFVNGYSNGCEAKQGFYTLWGGSPQPSGDEIMNLFTPNGDGFNDVWVVNDPQLVSPFKVSVYNRSGKQVFSNNNYQNTWDGQYNNNPLPQATYYYIIEDSDGKTFKGAVTIIR